MEHGEGLRVIVKFKCHCGVSFVSEESFVIATEKENCSFGSGVEHWEGRGSTMDLVG